jgi:hypothetical protein
MPWSRPHRFISVYAHHLSQLSWFPGNWYSVGSRSAASRGFQRVEREIAKRSTYVHWSIRRVQAYRSIYKGSTTEGIGLGLRAVRAANEALSYRLFV